MSKKAPVTILILGLTAAGKTMTQFALKFGEVCTVVPTEGFNFHNLLYKKHKIECWDYGGSQLVQEKLWPEAISKANGIFWVVDANDRAKIPESLETLKSVVSKLSPEVPICILANKYDLPNVMDKNEITTEFASIRHSKLFPVIAVESKTMSEAYSWLMDEITGKKNDKKEKKDKKEKEKKEKKDKKDKKVSSARPGLKD